MLLLGGRLCALNCCEQDEKCLRQYSTTRLAGLVVGFGRVGPPDGVGVNRNAYVSEELGVGATSGGLGCPYKSKREGLDLTELPEAVRKRVPCLYVSSCRVCLVWYHFATRFVGFLADVRIDHYTRDFTTTKQTGDPRWMWKNNLEMCRIAARTLTRSSKHQPIKSPSPALYFKSEADD